MQNFSGYGVYLDSKSKETLSVGWAVGALKGRGVKVMSGIIRFSFQKITGCVVESGLQGPVRVWVGVWVWVDLPGVLRQWKQEMMVVVKTRALETKKKVQNSGRYGAKSRGVREYELLASALRVGRWRGRRVLFFEMRRAFKIGYGLGFIVSSLYKHIQHSAPL